MSAKKRIKHRAAEGPKKKPLLTKAADDPTATKRLSDADRIADRFVDLFNAEIERPNSNLLMILGGALLATHQFMSTSPEEEQPPIFFLLKQAMEVCLTSLARYVVSKESQDNTAPRA